ncbi:hypothetical protein [Pseudomonas reactans]|uniref:hypothetical protein n=1 Tax=Pseudomonas reactans TaxID=117680 RepID=UPI0015A334EC|nr:hypothetical protein [Pseudomonas reactans]NWA66254.1 hypothetical protein [Pseudomonas reactans]
MGKLSFKKAFFGVVGVWLALMVVAFVYSRLVTVGALIVYTGAIPFLLTVFWVSLSEPGLKLKESLKAWHWAVIASWLLFLYTLYARKWSAATLNSIFHVDPEKFSITYDFLAFAYAPVSILYQPDLTLGLLIISVALATGLAPLIIFSLIANIGWRTVLKWYGLLLACVYLISFFLTIAGNISRDVNKVAVQFALWADFNEKHTCTDSWSSFSKGVIFLEGGKVLSYFPDAGDGKYFEIKSCDMKERF